MRDLEYAYLKTRINHLIGIDLEDYRERQMRRRLTSFISRTTAPSVVAYCHMIEADRRMLEDLRGFLTIHVSEFFRDWLPFEQLRTEVQQALSQRYPGATAELVLTDFRSAVLGRITLETPQEFDAWLAVGQAQEAERKARKEEQERRRKRRNKDD